MALNVRSFLKAIGLIPNATQQISAQGEIEYRSDLAKLSIHDGTSADSVVQEAKAAALTNKTINPASNTITLTSANVLVGSAGNAAAGVALTGDISITNAGATTVGTVGTSSAANIHSAELAANAATNLNTASTIVKRDASGNFNAGTITAALSGNVTGNVSGTAANVTGIVAPANGGTGVNNGGTLTLGANNITLTTGGVTSVTLPASGTLSTLAGVESLTNKTIGDALTLTQITTPTNPAASKDKIYTKADDKLYILNSAGVEVKAGGGLNPWAASTAYVVGDVVSYEKQAYIALSAHTSSSAFETDIAAGNKWSLLNTPQVSPNLMLVGNNFEDGDVGGWTAVHSSLVNGLPVTFSYPGASYVTGQYIFTVIAANATVGATYTNNTQTFTVVSTIAAGTNLVMTGTGAPLASGTLTKATGTGDATITFSAVTSTTKGANTGAPAVDGVSLSGTPAINGAFSLDLNTTGAGTIGDGYISQAYSVSPIFRARVLTFNFAYKVIAGTPNLSGTSSNTYAVAIYDVTNNAWLGSTGNFSITQGTGVGIASGTFQTAINTAAIQIFIYSPVAPTGASQLFLDDFYIGPQTIVQGTPVTDWQSYIPTFSGFGTVTGISTFWRRVGDSVEIQGSFISGTATATLAQIGLPSGLSTDSVKVVSNVQVGVGAISTTGAQYYTMLAAVGSPYVNIGLSSTGVAGTSPINANAFIVNGNTFTFTAKVPIAGWSSNVQMSSDSSTRVVAASISTSTAQTMGVGLTQVQFNTVLGDTHSGWSNSTYVYTVPVTGWYDVSGYVSFGGTTSGVQITTQVYKNGTAYLSTQSGQYMAGSAYGPGGAFTFLVNCKAGDTLAIYSTDGNVTTLNTNTPANTVLNIKMVSGPSQIAASESVNAQIGPISTNPVYGAASIVIIDTKEFDSHNAYNTTTGLYTVPISGKYLVSAIGYANAGTATLQIYKNGSVARQLVYINGALQYSGSTTISCNAGDTLAYWVDRAVTLLGSNVSLSITRVGN